MDASVFNNDLIPHFILDNQPFIAPTLTRPSHTTLYDNFTTNHFHGQRGARQNMSTFDPDSYLQQLFACKYLPEHSMKLLCDRVRALLLEESNIQPVYSPVTICGDIHGQFWDLLELLRKGGSIPETSYIFMASRLRME